MAGRETAVEKYVAPLASEEREQLLDFHRSTRLLTKARAGSLSDAPTHCRRAPTQGASPLRAKQADDFDGIFDLTLPRRTKHQTTPAVSSMALPTPLFRETTESTFTP